MKGAESATSTWLSAQGKVTLFVKIIHAYYVLCNVMPNFWKKTLLMNYLLNADLKNLPFKVQNISPIVLPQQSCANEIYCIGFCFKYSLDFTWLNSHIII